MIEFAFFIEEQWAIPYDIAENICQHYSEGSSKYFVSHYVPFIAAQVDFDVVSEIYDFLDKQRTLNAQRKKTITIMKKADLFDDDVKEKVELSITQTELEDISIAYKTTRTRGVIAAGKGLDKAADTIDDQKSEGNLDDLLKEYVGKDETLTDVETVKTGIVDILAERYGFDEGIRITIREFLEDEGSIELFHKKKTKKYTKFAEPVRIEEISDEDFLFLRLGEEKGDIKVKITVPIFMIDEILNEQIIENEDAIGIELIKLALNSAWDRFLQPMAEESIKEHLYGEAEEHISREIKRDFRPIVEEHVTSAKKTLLVVAAYSENEMQLLTVDNSGQLLRSTTDTIREYGRTFVSSKIKQLFELYHPTQIVVLDNKYGENTLKIVEHTVNSMVSKPEINSVASTSKINAILKSEYLKKSFIGLEENSLKAYALGITVLVPFNILMHIGTACFDLHEKQVLITATQMDKIIEEIYTAEALIRGVEIGKKNDYLLRKLGLSEEQLNALRKQKKKRKLKSKLSLKSIEIINEKTFHNIAGYIIFPESHTVLDKSTVHPELFGLVNSICSELGMEPLDIIKNFDKLENFQTEDESVGIFIRENISKQFKVAQRYQSLSSKPKRRLRMNEIRKDAILDGKVTNITKFGVFIDINAFSDGLVHISELTNEFVESAEQVVAVGDAVKVKVIEVDRGKKRISLSMKQADNSGLKIKASRTQINDLLKFFNK